MRVSLALSLSLLLASAGVASAQDAGLSASEWLIRAEDAEDRAQPVEAIDAWRHLIEVAPTSRLAGRGRTRIAWMEARSEGDYAPLATMMAYLGRGPAERGEDVVAAFERAASTMPPGRVRAESRMAIASDWQRLGDATRARTAWELALGDPALEAGERTLVRETMARARMESGDPAGAMDELEDADLEGLSLHETAARRLRIATWVPVSYGVLATFALVVLALIARSGRTKAVLGSLRAEPLRVVIALVVGLGPYAIVRWWGDESLGAFEALAPFSFAIVLASYLAAEATERRELRALVAVLAITSALAAAYVSAALYGEALPFA